MDMKPVRSSLLALAAGCLSVALSGPAGAAFLDSGWGARPLGMGGAFTAVADGANATLYNPAGIAGTDCQEVSFMSAKLFTGLDGVEIGQNYFGYVYPLSPAAGNLGITWASLYTPELYREDTFALSYAHGLGRAFGLENSRVSLGANLKYLKHEYTTDRRSTSDPVFGSGLGRGNFSLDAGALVDFQEAGVSLGCMSKNVNSPDVGLKTEDKVPNENVLGFAFYQRRLANNILPLEYFTFSLDLVLRSGPGSGTGSVRAGMESRFFDGKLAARLGFQTSAVTAGAGYDFAAWRGAELGLDYAFAWPLEVEQTMGTHRLGVSLRFP